MLEHVPDPPSTVRACARLVKPGGQVFFSTINRNPKSFLFAIVGAEYVLSLLPQRHARVRALHPPLGARARTAARRASRVDDLTGMTYNPLTKAYALGRDVDVNYLARSAPWLKRCSSTSTARSPIPPGHGAHGERDAQAPRPARPSPAGTGAALTSRRARAA